MMVRAVAICILAVSVLVGAALVLPFVWAIEGVVGVVSLVWILAIGWAIFVLDHAEGSGEP